MATETELRAAFYAARKAHAAALQHCAEVRAQYEAAVLAAYQAEQEVRVRSEAYADHMDQ